MRFYAQAELNRAAGDTLLVRLSARNRGRLVREINVGGCGHPNAVRVVAVGARQATWDPGPRKCLEAGYFNAGEVELRPPPT